MKTFKVPTTLLQPTPDTLFRKGSIIAIYDDIPDMAGHIETNELVQAATGVGLNLEWEAELK